MKINPLLAGSAVLYGMAGVALTFAPQEFTSAMGATPSAFGSWLAQLLGGGLLSIAWLNWLQRYATVGGILGRPVLFTNLLFLSVAFWSSIDAWRHHSVAGALSVAVVLGAVAIPFGLRLFSAPPRVPGSQ